MQTLTIRGLPDPIYERLKAQAEAHRRSLNAEVIACLERAVSASPFDATAWLDEARAFREGLTDREALRGRLARESRRAGRGIAGEVRRIQERVARLPVLDARTPDEILGYDKDGLPI